MARQLRGIFLPLLLFVCLLALLPLTQAACPAQPVPDFTHTLTSLGDDRAHTVAAAPDGSFAIAAQITGSPFAAFNSSGGRDIAVLYFNATGALLWSYQTGSAGDDAPAGVAVDAAKNVYVAASAAGSINAQSAAGQRDIVVIKLDSAGSPVWTFQTGTASDDDALAIALTPDAQTLYVSASTQGALAAANAGATDAVALRINATSGQQIWAAQFGSVADDSYAAIAVDSANNLYLGGHSHAALLSLPYAGGDADGYVIKLNSTGALLAKAHVAASATADRLFALALSLDASTLYAAGSSNTSGYITPLSTSSLTPAQSLPVQSTPSATTACTHLAILSGGAIVVAGSTTGNLAAPNAGATDLFALVLSPELTTTLAAYQYGSNSTDTPKGLAVSACSPSDTFVLLADTTADFPPNTLGDNGTDIVYLQQTLATHATPVVRNLPAAFRPTLAMAFPASVDVATSVYTQALTLHLNCSACSIYLPTQAYGAPAGNASANFAFVANPATLTAVLRALRIDASPTQDPADNLLVTVLDAPHQSTYTVRLLNPHFTATLATTLVAPADVAYDAFANTLVCGYQDDAFYLASINATGHANWLIHTTAAAGVQACLGLAVDADSNIYAVGSTTAAVPQLGITTLSGALDAIVVKISYQGQLLWGHADLSTANDDALTDVLVGPSGAVVVAGYSTASNNARIASLNPATGSAQWDTTWSTTSVVQGLALCLDPATSDIYLAAGPDTAHLAKFSSTGSLITATSIAGAGQQRFVACVATAQHVYVAAASTSPAFNGYPNPTQAGQSWLLKYTRDLAPLWTVPLDAQGSADADTPYDLALLPGDRLLLAGQHASSAYLALFEPSLGAQLAYWHLPSPNRTAALVASRDGSLAYVAADSTGTRLSTQPAYNSPPYIQALPSVVVGSRSALAPLAGPSPIRARDPDASDATLFQLGVSCASQACVLALTSQVTSLTGNNTHTLALTATLAQLDALWPALYASFAADAAVDTLSFVLSDQGHTGAALPDPTSQTFRANISVAVRCAPGPAYESTLVASGSQTFVASAVDAFGSQILALTTDAALPAASAYGATDIAAAKYARDGSLQWTYQTGTAANEQAHAVAVDPDDASVYLLASAAPGFHNQSAIGGATDAFVIKLSPDGKRLWSRGLGSPNTDTPSAAAVLPDASLAAVAHSDNAVLAARLHPNGTTLWTTSIASAGTDLSHGLCADANGDIYLLASSDASFDSNTALGARDIVLLKYSLAGVKLWSAQLGGSAADTPSACLIRDGSLYVAATYNSTARLYRVNATTGALQWSAPTGVTTPHAAAALAPMPSGALLLAAHSVVALFDPTTGALLGIQYPAADIASLHYACNGQTLTAGQQGANVYAATLALTPHIAGLPHPSYVHWLVATRQSAPLAQATVTVQDFDADPAHVYTLTLAATHAAITLPSHQAHISLQGNGSSLLVLRSTLQGIAPALSLLTVALPQPDLRDNLTLSIADFLGHNASYSMAFRSQPVAWTQQFGTPADDAIRAAVANDARDATYIAGTTSAGLFAPASLGARDTYLARLDAQGQPVWSHQYGTAGDDVDVSLALNQLNHTLYVAGTTAASLHAQPFLGGLSDVYLSRYATLDGARAWTTQFGSNAADRLAHISLLPDGSLIACGSTAGSLASAANANANPGSDDAWVAHLYANGSLAWAFHYGGSANDSMAACHYDSARQSLVCLAASQSTDLPYANSTLSTNGTTHALLLSWPLLSNQTHMPPTNLVPSVQILLAPAQPVALLLRQDAILALANTATHPALLAFHPVTHASLWHTNWGSAATQATALDYDAPQGLILVAGTTTAPIDPQHPLIGSADVFIAAFNPLTGDRTATIPFGTSAADASASSVLGHLLPITVSASLDDRIYQGATDAALKVIRPFNVLPTLDGLPPALHVDYRNDYPLGQQYPLTVNGAETPASTMVLLANCSSCRLWFAASSLAANITGNGTASVSIRGSTQHTQDAWATLRLDSPTVTLQDTLQVTIGQPYASNLPLLQQVPALGPHTVYTLATDFNAFNFVRQWGSTGSDRWLALRRNPADTTLWAVGSADAPVEGQPNAGADDFVLAHLNVQGTLLNLRTYGTAQADRWLALDIDHASSTLYACGYTSASFMSSTAYGGRDAILVSINMNTLNANWAVSIGSSGHDECTAVAVHPQTSRVYIAGFATGALPTKTHAGARDAFVAAYSTSGTLAWAHQTGGTGDDAFHGIDVDAQGRIWAAGYANSSFDGQTNSGLADYLVAAFSSDGTRTLLAIHGDAADQALFNLRVDDNDRVLVVGRNAGNALAARLDTTTGAFRWHTSIASPSQDVALALDAAADALWITGYTEGSLCPGCRFTGVQDLFLAKLGAETGVHYATMQFGTHDTLQTARGTGVAIAGASTIFAAGSTTGLVAGAPPGTQPKGASDFLFLSVRTFNDAPRIHYLPTALQAQSNRPLSLGSASRVADVDGYGTALFALNITCSSCVIRLPQHVHVDFLAGARDNTAAVSVRGTQAQLSTALAAFDFFFSQQFATGSIDLSLEDYGANGDKALPTHPVSTYHVAVNISCAGATAWNASLATVAATAEVPLDVVADSLDNVYVAGYTSGALVGHTSAGSDDLTLVSYTRDGTLRWSYQTGSTGADRANGVAFHPATNALYLAGYASAALHAQAHAGGLDALLLRLDVSTNATRVWTHLNGTASADVYNDVAVASDGHPVVVGQLAGQAVVAKVHATSAAILWQVVSPASTQALAVATSPYGDIYVAGTTTASAAAHGGASDILVQRFSSAGELLWSSIVGTVAADSLAKGFIFDDATSSLYLAANSDAAARFVHYNTAAGLAASPLAATGAAAYVVALDVNGNVRWAHSLDVAGDQKAHALTRRRSSVLLAIGSTTAAFAPHTQAGTRDIFVAQLHLADGVRFALDQWGYAGASLDPVAPQYTCTAFLPVATATNAALPGISFAGGSSDTVLLSRPLSVPQPSLVGIPSKIALVADVPMALGQAYPLVVVPLNGSTAQMTLQVAAGPTGRLTAATGGPLPLLSASGNATELQAFWASLSLVYNTTTPNPSLTVTIDAATTYTVPVQLACIATSAAHGQAGTSAADVAHALVADNAGNAYIGGYTSGAFPGFANQGTDGVVAKLDQNRELLWAYQLEFSTSDAVEAIAVDPNSGNLYAVGWVDAAIPPVQAYGGARDILAFKLDADGNRLWITTLGGSGGEQAATAAFDAARGLLFLGATTASASIQGHASLGGIDLFFATLHASNGSLVWSARHGTAQNDYVNAVALAADGSFFAAGYTFGALQGQTQLGASQNAYIARFNPTGALQWAFQCGDGLYGQDVALSSDAASVYLAAYGSSGAAFIYYDNDASFRRIESAGLIDAILFSFEPTTGAIQWRRTLAGAGNDYATALAPLPNTDVAVVGYTSSNPFMGVARTGSLDAFVVVYTADGTRVENRLVGVASASYIARDATLDCTPDTLLLGGYINAALPGKSQLGGNDFALSVAQLAARQPAVNGLPQAIELTPNTPYALGALHPVVVLSVAGPAADIPFNVSCGSSCTLTGPSIGSVSSLVLSANASALTNLWATLAVTFDGTENTPTLVVSAGTAYAHHVPVTVRCATNPPVNALVGLAGSDPGVTSALDAAGNMYIAGYTDGSFPGFTAGTFDDTFLVKLDRTGTPVWYHQFALAGNQQIYTMAVDKQTGVPYVGIHSETAILGASIVGSYDNILVKFDPVSGQPQWAALVGSTGHDIPRGVVAMNGRACMVGNVQGNIPGFTQVGGVDAMAMCADARNGTILYSAGVGSAATDQFIGADLASDGTLYAAGETWGSLDARGLANQGGTDILLTRFNVDGSIAWTRAIGGPGTDAAYAVAVSPDNANVYITGEATNDLFYIDSSGSRRVITHVPASAHAVPFFIKASSAGEILFGTMLSPSAATRGFGIQVRPNHEIVIAGYTTANLFATRLGTTDIFHAVFRPEGNLMYGGQYGYAGFNGVFYFDPTDITCDSVTYAMYLTANPPPGTSLVGGNDAVLIKRSLYPQQPSISGLPAAISVDATAAYSLGALHPIAIDSLNGPSANLLFNVSCGASCTLSGPTVGTTSAINTVGNATSLAALWNSLSVSFTGAVSEPTLTVSVGSVYAYSVPVTVRCAVTAEKTRFIGTAAADYVNGMAIDDKANTYIGGYTQGALPGNSNAGSNDFAVVKVARDGVPQWYFQAGTANSDVLLNIVVDPSQNYVYALGYTSASIYGHSVVGSNDVFVMKLNAEGHRVWSTILGSTSADYAAAATVGTDGELYVASYFAAAAFGQPHLGSNDVYILKLSAKNASHLWTLPIATTASDVPRAIEAASDGTFYVTGYTGGSLGTLPNQGSNDIFVTRFDAQANILWTITLGGTGADAAEALAVASDASAIYLACSIAGEIRYRDHQGSITATGRLGAGLALAKILPDGSTQWVHTWQRSHANDRFTGVSIRPSGEVVVSGHQAGSLFAPLVGTRDVIAVAVLPDGTQTYAKTYGAASADLNTVAGAVDCSNTLVTVAYGSGGTFPGTTALGSVDIIFNHVTIPAPQPRINALPTYIQATTGQTYPLGASHQLNLFVPAGTYAKYAFNVTCDASCKLSLPPLGNQLQLIANSSSSVAVYGNASALAAWWPSLALTFDGSNNLPSLTVSIGAHTTYAISVALRCPIPVTTNSQFGSSSTDALADAVADIHNNLYATGSAVNALPGMSSSGAGDIAVVKLNPSGAPIWYYQRGSASADAATGIAVDPVTGDSYVVANTAAALAGSHAGATDLVVLKLNAHGVLLWEYQYGTTANDEATSITLAADGHLYLTARYANGQTLLGAAPLGASDAFVIKVSPTNGTVLWTRRLGTASEDTATKVVDASDAHIYVTGLTQGTMAAPGNVNANGVFVTKISYTGVVAWTAQFSATATAAMPTIAVSPDASLVYCTMTLVSSRATAVAIGANAEPLFATFDGNSNGLVLAQLDAATGTFKWLRTLPTVGNSNVHAPVLHTLPSGSVYVFGTTTAAVAGTTITGSKDIYALLYHRDGRTTGVATYGFASTALDLGAAIVGCNGHVRFLGDVSSALPGAAAVGGADMFHFSAALPVEPPRIVGLPAQLDVDAGVRAYVGAANPLTVYVPSTQNTLTQFNISCGPDCLAWFGDTGVVTALVTNSSSNISVLATPAQFSAFWTGFSVAFHTHTAAPSIRVLANSNAYTVPVTVRCNSVNEFTRRDQTTAADTSAALAIDRNSDAFHGITTAGALFAANAGSNDIALTKVDRTGQRVWAIQFGSTADDSLAALAVGRTHLYAAGTTQGALPGLAAPGAPDAFLAKIDKATGEQVFLSTPLAHAAADNAAAVALSHDNSIAYLVGDVTGALPNTTNAGSSDVFVAAVHTNNGTLAWARLFGVAAADTARAVAVDSQHSIWVVGAGQGLAGHPANGNTDVQLVQYAHNGTVLRTALFGSTGNDLAHSLWIDSTNADRMYIAGEVDSAATSFYGDSVAHGGSSGFVIVVDPNTAARVWSTVVSTSANDAIRAVTVNRIGSIVIAGTTAGSLSGQTNAGSDDAFVRGLHPANGTVQWTLQLGSAQQDILVGLSSDCNGYLYLAGHTSNAAFGGVAQVGTNMSPWLTVVQTPNTAPILTLNATTMVAVEDEDRPLPSIHVSDVDALPNHVFSFNISATRGQLAFAGNASFLNVHFAPGKNNASSSLLFDATLAQFNAQGAANLRYLPNLHNHDADTIYIHVSDNGGWGGGGVRDTLATIDVSFVARNDPLERVSPAWMANYTMDESSSLVLPVQLSDVDALPDMVTVVISAQHGALTLSSLAGISFAQASANNGSMLHFNGTLSSVNAALASLTYHSAYLGWHDTVFFHACDNAEGISSCTQQTTNITVLPFNNPIVFLPPVPPSWFTTPEDITFLIAPGFHVADADLAGYNASLRITTAFGRVDLASTAGMYFANASTAANQSYVEAVGSLTALNAALASLAYHPASQFSGVDTIHVSISDQGAQQGAPTHVSHTMQVNVTAVNDPVFFVGGPSSVVSLPSLADTNVTGFAVTDLDAADFNMRLIASVQHGRISMLQHQDQMSIDITDTLTNLNLALADLHYFSVPDHVGADAIVLTVYDLGNSGAGPSYSRQRVVNITVTAVQPTIVWTGNASDGNMWNTPSNWNPVRVPTPADVVLINSTAMETVQLQLTESSVITLARLNVLGMASLNITGHNASLDIQQGALFAPGVSVSLQAGTTLVARGNVYAQGAVHLHSATLMTAAGSPAYSLRVPGHVYVHPGVSRLHGLLLRLGSLSMLENGLGLNLTTGATATRVEVASMLNWQHGILAGPGSLALLATASGSLAAGVSLDASHLQTLPGSVLTSHWLFCGNAASLRAAGTWLMQAPVTGNVSQPVRHSGGELCDIGADPSGNWTLAYAGMPQHTLVIQSKVRNEPASVMTIQTAITHVYAHWLQRGTVHGMRMLLDAPSVVVDWHTSDILSLQCTQAQFNKYTLQPARIHSLSVGQACVVRVQPQSACHVTTLVLDKGRIDTYQDAVMTMDGSMDWVNGDVLPHGTNGRLELIGTMNTRF